MTERKITEGYKYNYETLLKAAANGDLGLAALKRKDSDKVDIVLVARSPVEENQAADDDRLTLVPFAVMFDGNPYEIYEPPFKKENNNGSNTR